MERKYANAEQALNVAKEAMFLAWQACGGPKQDRETVWDHAYNERDYSGGRREGSKHVNADYVMGRMMKLRFKIDGDSIDIPDHEPRRDYQAWCGQYQTYAALFDAAEESCGIRKAKAA
jgi:hypothetical protein